MRIAVLGAAASALLGGTLAVTPLTSVSTPLQTATTCGKSGVVCDKVASVLMPETPAPSGASAPSAQFGAEPAGNVVTPPGPAEPGGAAAPASGEVPALSSPGLGGGGGVPSADALPGVGIA